MKTSSGFRVTVSFLLACFTGLAAGSPASAQRWTTRVDHRAEGVQVTDDGTTLVFGGRQPGWVSLVDGPTGAVRWQYRSRGDRIRGVAVSADGSRIAVADAFTVVPDTDHSDELLAMLDRNGRTVWERRSPGAVRMSPAGDYLLAYDR